MRRWFKRFLVDPGDTTLVQLPRALIASTVVSALDFGLLVILVEAIGWAPDIAAVTSFVIAGLLQYILCATWVFAASGNAVGFVAFMLLNSVALGITWLTMTLVHDHAGVHYTIAKLIAFVFAFVWNFVSRKYFVFRTVRAS